MNPDIVYLMAMSCTIPAVAGVARYKQIEARYRPFVFLMLLDVAIETIYRLNYNPALAFNIYLVASFGLFLYFVFINHFLGRRAVPIFITALVIAVVNFFYYETICAPFLNNFTNIVLLRSSYLLCFTLVVMLFVCIDILSKQITAIKDKLVNNCWFWISSVYVLSLSYNLLIFGLYIFAMSDTPNAKAIGTIQHFINLICYIFFTVAIIKMRVRIKKPGVNYTGNKMKEYVV